ncbi:MAG: acyl carrier protein [Verrucomicrobiae bacterium]|nr:acyl carrier protein [Verrucomicrobiae bacterium]
MSEPTKEDTILAKLKDIIDESSDTEIDWSEISINSPVEALGLDSLSILDLLYDIEQETGIRVEADEVSHIGTLKDIVSLLIRKGA